MLTLHPLMRARQIEREPAWGRLAAVVQIQVDRDC